MRSLGSVSPYNFSQLYYTITTIFVCIEFHIPGVEVSLIFLIFSLVIIVSIYVLVQITSEIDKQMQQS